MQITAGEFRSGRKIINVPFSSCSWRQVLNDRDQLQFTIPLYASSDASEKYRSLVNDARRLDPMNTLTPYKTFCVVEDEGMSVGGILLSADPDADKETLTCTVGGMWSYWDARTIEKPAVFANPGLLLNPEGTPNEAYDTVFNPADGRTMGDIVTLLVQQALDCPAGDVPVILPGLKGGGSTQKTYRAIDLVYLGTALDNIVKLRLGVDVGFFPRRSADRLGFEWELVTGDPRFGDRGRPHRWDFTGRGRDLESLTGSNDGSRMATTAWYTGGRSSDKVLIAKATNPAFTDAGGPLIEIVDSSHGTVQDDDTLRQYADEYVAKNGMPVTTRGFKVHRDSITLGEIRVGEWCTIRTKNHPLFGTGRMLRRITSISGSTDSMFVTIETEQQYADSTQFINQEEDTSE